MSTRRKKRRSRPTRRDSRRLFRIAAIVLTLALLIWGMAGVWFVHHPPKWVARALRTYPTIITAPLLWIGNPLGDITDGLSLTGHDAVYEYDEPAPTGSPLFAGIPKRTGFPAPADIHVVDRGDFILGWSPSLRHPVWCAYHVAKDVRYPVGKRPSFRRDNSLVRCPTASAYERSTYDRGHMAPNFAIASRYGEDAQRATFLMSNVSPQKPALNRGVWRDMEHRIAELWTARYGEVWVIVGCISPLDDNETISGTDIDVPAKFYQIVVAQEGLDVRALAVIFPQTIPWRAWPTRNLISIDDLESLTGLDFLPDLPSFIQDPLESELPSRLWPVRLRDILSQIAIRFKSY